MEQSKPVKGSKTFDKKKWRQKQYSTKFKKKQWEENYKKNALRKYYKQLKKEGIPGPSFQNKLETFRDDSDGNFDRRNTGSKLKPNSYKFAQQELEKRQKEKQEAIEEKRRKKEEIQEALEKYRKVKSEKFRKLSQKTKKGQPVMKDRLLMLYDKIKNSVETIS